MYAAGIFGNLSSDKPRLKEAIFQTGGVEIIMNTLKTSKRYRLGSYDFFTLHSSSIGLL